MKELLKHAWNGFWGGGPAVTPGLAVAGWLTWTTVRGLVGDVVLVGTGIVVSIHVINLVFRQWCPLRRQWPIIFAASTAAVASTTAAAVAVAAHTAATTASAAADAAASVAADAAAHAAATVTAAAMVAAAQVGITAPSAVSNAAAAAVVVANAAADAASTVARAAADAAHVAAAAATDAAAHALVTLEAGRKARLACGHCGFLNTFFCPIRTHAFSEED